MTRTQRRMITREFKYKSARLILDQDYTDRQACESLDLTETALRGWVKQLQAERDSRY
jgi:transposase